MQSAQNSLEEQSYKSYKVRYPRGRKKDIICGEEGGSVHIILEKKKKPLFQLSVI